MRIKLTDRYIRAIVPPASGGRLEIVDAVQPALRMRITDSDIKTWSISTRVNGRRRRFTVGRYPAVGLSDARERAGRILAEVRAGHDPVAEARADSAAPALLTISDAIGLYAQAVLANRRTGRVVERDMRRDLAELLDMPVGQCSKSDLARIVDRKARTAPIQANRLVACLKPFWRWCTARGHSAVNIAADLARERVLTDNELGAVWSAAGEMGDLWSPYFRLMILTAQRLREVAAMVWSELDLEKSVWVLPAERSKTGRAHTVHLPPPAVDILRELEERRGPHDLVFTTTGKTPISGFSKAKARLDQLSGVTSWRLHDFRRTAATKMADLGVDPAVADRILNHVGAGSMSTVQRVYQRSALDAPRRHAITAWADHITGLLKGDESADKIVRLRGRSR
jgi:integrase